MSKGFKIECLECGSNNVYIQEEIDYDWDENPYVSGYHLECGDCGNTDMHMDY